MASFFVMEKSRPGCGSKKKREGSRPEFSVSTSSDRHPDSIAVFAIYFHAHLFVCSSVWASICDSFICLFNRYLLYTFDFHAGKGEK